MENNKAFFRSMVGNGKFIDIGCGEYAASHVGDLIGLNIGVEKVVLVEPCAEEDEMRGNLAEQKARGQADFVQQGGLTFLLTQENGSGNPITTSIDIDVVGDLSYLQRMAQEIYRLVPPNGCFISILSREIEEEARKLFPFEKCLGQNGQVKVFYKEKSQQEKMGERVPDFASQLNAGIEELELELEREKNQKDGAKKLLITNERINLLSSVKHNLKILTGSFDNTDREKEIERCGEKHRGSIEDNWLHEVNSADDERKQQAIIDLAYNLEVYALEMGYDDPEEPMRKLFLEIIDFIKEYIQGTGDNFEYPEHPEDE